VEQLTGNGGLRTSVRLHLTTASAQCSAVARGYIVPRYIPRTMSSAPTNTLLRLLWATHTYLSVSFNWAATILHQQILHTDQCRLDWQTLTLQHSHVTNRRTHSPSQVAWSEGRRPLGGVLHSPDEPSELSQWPCGHDDSTKISSWVLLLLLLLRLYITFFFSSKCVTYQPIKFQFIVDKSEDMHRWMNAANLSLHSKPSLENCHKFV